VQIYLFLTAIAPPCGTQVDVKWVDPKHLIVNPPNSIIVPGGSNFVKLAFKTNGTALSANVKLSGTTYQPGTPVTKTIKIIAP
jgi:hypothetical protein